MTTAAMDYSMLDHMISLQVAHIGSCNMNQREHESRASNINGLTGTQGDV